MLPCAPVCSWLLSEVRGSHRTYGSLAKCRSQSRPSRADATPLAAGRRSGSRSLHDRPAATEIDRPRTTFSEVAGRQQTDSSTAASSQLAALAPASHRGGRGREARRTVDKLLVPRVRVELHHRALHTLQRELAVRHSGLARAGKRLRVGQNEPKEPCVDLGNRLEMPRPQPP